MKNMPSSGRILGIDVGYSEKRATTGFCLLSWTRHAITWDYAKAISALRDRQSAITDLLGDVSDPVLAVGIDGPLRPGLRIEKTYRACEALLSRGPLQRRGKPGQSNSPAGWRLHREATRLAKLAIQLCTVGEATWYSRIHDRAVVEAFPNFFLACLVDEVAFPAKPSKERKWTDELFRLARGMVARLLAKLLPDRRPRLDLEEVKDHEHVAALICAMSALVALSRDGVLVGSESDGDIVLPPPQFWGTGRPGQPPWMVSALTQNLPAVRQRFPDARILDLATGRTLD
jgi:hypothetical protein